MNYDAQTTILIVHPIPKVRNVVQASLGLRDMRVIKMADAEDTLRSLQNEQPDLILSEVDLPGMDGFQLLSRARMVLRSLGMEAGQVPFIFMGGGNDPREPARGLRMGAEDYLRKPFSMDELIVRVENVLKRRELAQTDRGVDHIKGRLEKLPAAKLLGWLSQDNWTGRLTLEFTGEKRDATLIARHGDLIHGEFGFLRGRSAALQSLLYPQGEFRFQFGQRYAEGEVTIVGPTSLVLAESRRLIAEGRLRRVDVSDRTACADFEQSIAVSAAEGGGQPFSSGSEIEDLPGASTSVEIQIEDNEDDDFSIPEWLDAALGPAAANASDVVEALEATTTVQAGDETETDLDADSGGDSSADSGAGFDSDFEDDLERFDEEMMETASLVIEAGDGGDPSTSSIVIAAEDFDEDGDEEERDYELAEALKPKPSLTMDPVDSQLIAVELVDRGPGPVERLFGALQSRLLGKNTGVNEFQICTRSGRVLASSIDDRQRRIKLAEFSAQAIEFGQRSEMGTFAEISAAGLNLLVVELPYKRLLVCSFTNPPKPQAFLDFLRDTLSDIEEATPT